MNCFKRIAQTHFGREGVGSHSVDVLRRVQDCEPIALLVFAPRRTLNLDANELPIKHDRDEKQHQTSRHDNRRHKPANHVAVPPENKLPETTRPPKRRPRNVEPDQIWRSFITESTSRCACALSMLYLATTWVTRSSLLLSAPSSCSENLPHLAPISLRRIFLVSAGLSMLADTAFGFTVFMCVFSKISMKHHLNVQHSNNSCLWRAIAAIIGVIVQNKFAYIDPGRMRQVPMIGPTVKIA